VKEERKCGIPVFEWLKDLLIIYTWKELWIVISVPTAIMGLWFLFCFLLTIPIVLIRAIAIWTMVSLLTAGSAAVDALRKRATK